MNVRELKEIIKDLPDDMPVGLWDLSTDSFTDGNYSLNKGDFLVEDYLKEEDDHEPAGKMLFITFDNNLNENSIAREPLREDCSNL